MLCALPGQAFGLGELNSKLSTGNQPTWGESAEAVVAPSGADVDEVPVNPELMASTTKALKSLLQVKKEEEGLFVIRSPKKKYTPGSYVLFMRRLRDGIDMLGRGKVEGQQGSLVYIELLTESVIKIPRKGDYVVIMAPPWVPDSQSMDPPAQGSIATTPPPIPGDPGHIELGWGSLGGSLDSTSSNLANAYKKSDYKFSLTHFEWFIEFLWRFGIEYEKYAGVYPTSSYFRRDEKTEQSFTTLTLHYRLRKMFWGYFRPSFRMVRVSDEFTTTNPDEALMSSTYSGFGGGIRLATEFTSNVWRAKGYFPFALHQIFFDYTHLPILDIKDVGLSRGSSAGSTGSSWRVGVTLLMHLKWLPWVNRFVFNAYYGKRNYDLKFKGTTVSDSAYDIPEGGSYTETYDYTAFTVGVRFDDVIGKFLMPR